MRQSLSTLQKVKTGVHALQAVLIFVAACITIAVFTTGGGSTDGRTKWYFAVCWLSIPGIIYLVAVPIWSRAANIAKALWFAIVDVLFAIFWLSAFAAVLSWNNVGIAQGAEDKKIPKGEASCTTFAFGSEKKCKLSYTASSFGVVIFITFLASAGISIFYTIKAKKNPELDDPWLAPQSSQKYKPTGMSDMENGQKDPVWDSNTQDLDGHHDGDSDDERLGGGHGYNGEPDQGHPGRPVNWGQGPFDDSNAAPSYQDTEYRGASNYQPPSAMSPTSMYSSQNRDPPDYSTARTGRSGGGYSFSAPHADA